MVVQTVFVFWLAPAIPIMQISVFPPNPRLAKLSIAAIEPIDEVQPLVIGRVHVLPSGGTESGWQAANRSVGQNLDASV